MLEGIVGLLPSRERRTRPLLNSARLYRDRQFKRSQTVSILSSSLVLTVVAAGVVLALGWSMASFILIFAGGGLVASIRRALKEEPQNDPATQPNLPSAPVLPSFSKSATFHPVLQQHQPVLLNSAQIRQKPPRLRDVVNVVKCANAFSAVNRLLNVPKVS